MSSRMQVVDEAAGPTTQREWAMASVAAGDALTGQVVDWQARPQVRGICGQPSWHCPAARFHAGGGVTVLPSASRREETSRWEASSRCRC